MRLSLASLVTLLGALCAGGCGPRSQEDGKGAISERDVPAREHVRFAVPLGAPAGAQVLLVLTDRPSACDGWLPTASNQRFLVCVSAPAAESAALARLALADLKKAYGVQVAKPPVLLVADSSRSELGRTLMLEEATFFSDVILFVPQLELVPNAAVHGFAERGGRSLALVTPEAPPLERFLVSVRSAPLYFKRFVPGPRAGQEALTFINGRPVPPSAPPNPAPESVEAAGSTPPILSK